MVNTVIQAVETRGLVKCPNRHSFAIPGHRCINNYCTPETCRHGIISDQ